MESITILQEWREDPRFAIKDKAFRIMDIAIFGHEEGIHLSLSLFFFKSIIKFAIQRNKSLSKNVIVSNTEYRAIILTYLPRKNLNWNTEWPTSLQVGRDVSYRLAPPASGETMQPFLHSGMVSLIHFRTAGSAYRLSTGMSKNPCSKIIKSQNMNSEVTKPCLFGIRLFVYLAYRTGQSMDLTVIGNPVFTLSRDQRN